MRLIVDWHIHSKYSRACSKELLLPNIAQWCVWKGIDVVATGDWTHPAWFAHLKEELVPAEQGMYRWKGATGDMARIRFMLVTEVSQIYKRGGVTRRVHNLLFSPSLEVCEEVNTMLTRDGFNIRADGRPILGIDSEELYKRLRAIDERIIVVPAHAWTPWFSVFGSKSGFDTLEACFGDMTPYVYAIETGLSSDPLMNWKLSGLDSVMLVSNSDAHSCEKLGREANVFDVDVSTYDEFVRILREKDTKRFLYTIEFFPEEGMYHLDGCANDAFSCEPTHSLKIDCRCPTCKRKLTLGVLHRVESLKDRDPEAVRSRKVPYKSIVPLPEVIADAFGVSSPSSKKVKAEWQRLIQAFGNEFRILLDVSHADLLSVVSNPLVAEGIQRVRAGKVEISPGYDGVYGTVRLFSAKERVPSKKQTRLF